MERPVKIKIVALCALCVACIARLDAAETCSAPPEATKGPFAPVFSIKGPDDQKPWEKTAMRELEEYLARRIGAARVTVGGHSNVVFHVGDTALAADMGLESGRMEDEAWVIRSFGGNVVLTGGGTRGCLYAVYHFLEDFCGVRWWSETEEDVLDSGDLVLPPLDVRGKPAFIYRDVFRTTDPKKSQSRLAVRRRLNRNGDVPVPMSLGGAFTYGPPKHCHTFNSYVSWEKLGKTRPELFSLRDGVRCGGQDYNKGGQLCLTNPDVRKIILEGLLSNIVTSAADAKAKGLPAPKLFEISMNDNKRFCQCNACKAETEKYGHSGFYLNFINSIASEVAKTHPEACITTLAYYYTEEPPKRGVKAAPNVLVKLCNTRANMADTILAPGDNAIMRNLLEAWMSVAEHLFVWDYDITYTKDSKGYPFPGEWHYADKFRFYAAHRVHGIFWEQESPDTSDLFDLKFYLKTKLFENPDVDYPALLRRTFDEYYGPKAGPLVYAARRRLCDAQRRNKGRLYWFPQLNQFNFIRGEDVAAMQEMYDKAERMSADDERRLRRIRKTRAGLDRLAARREGAMVRGSFEGRPCWEFNPDKFALYGKERTVLVDDAAAPTGKAVELAKEKGYESPLLVAYYDSGTKKQPFSTRLKIDDGSVKYAWHDLGRATLAENGYFFMTKSWVVQMHIPSPDFAGKTFEVKVCACKTQDGKIRIGRMVLLDVGNTTENNAEKEEMKR